MPKSLVVAPAFYLVFDGQSLNNTGNFPLAVKNRIMALTGLPTNKVLLKNVAISGVSWDGLTPTFANRTAPHSKTSSKTVLIMNGDQAAVLADENAASLRTNANDYAALVNAAGFYKTVITTMPPASLVTLYTTNREAARVSFNSDLISNGVSNGNFDSVADVAGAMGTYASGLSAGWWDDTIHWSTTGAAVGAVPLADKIITLLGL